jgi:hypothetical protein
MGTIAGRVIRDWFPELPEPPFIYPQAVLGGSQRTFLFTGQPGSSQPRKIADLYAKLPRDGSWAHAARQLRRAKQVFQFIEVRGDDC